MRPVPSSKHILSIVIITTISLLSGYVAWQKQTLTPVQENFAAAALKAHNPNIMPKDSLFGTPNANGKLRQVNSPMFLALMQMTLVPNDYKDPTLPFKVGVIPFTFIFLCGMYSLLWQLCRSSTIACFTAVLSMTVISTLGQWQWGIGTLESITPAGVVVAFSPIILISYLHNKDRIQVVLTFMAIGVLGNFELISSVNFMLALLGVHFWNHRFSAKSIARASCCLLFFIIGCLPYLAYFLSLKHSISQAAVHTAVSAKIVTSALQIGDSELLSSRIFEESLNLFIYIAILSILSGLFLWQTRRFKPHGAGNWITFAAVSCFIALPVHGLTQLYAQLSQTAPPAVGFIQASCWIMLGLYILFALGLTHLFRMVRRSGIIVRYGLAGFMLLWMVPSANLQFFRHKLYAQIGNMVEEENRPLRLQEISDRKQKRDEYRQIARWAKTSERIPKNAIFITDSPEFRIYSEKSLLACQDDILYFYFLAPWHLKQWTNTFYNQSQCLGGNRTMRETINWLRKIQSRKPYNDVTNWYIVLPSRLAIWQDKTVPGFREINSPLWGRYWRVFEVKLPAVRTNQSEKPSKN